MCSAFTVSEATFIASNNLNGNVHGLVKAYVFRSGEQYSEAATGSPDQNNENSIAYHHLALQVRTTLCPNECAIKQMYLGCALSVRIPGDGSENTTDANKHYGAALCIDTCTNLKAMGTVTEQILEKSSHPKTRVSKKRISKTLSSFFRAALEVFVKYVSPKDCALINFSPGNAFLQRIRGVELKNIEYAMKH